MNKNYYFIITLFIFSFSAANAQSDWCATEEMMEKYVLNTPEKKAKYLQELNHFNSLVKESKDKKGKTSFVIPTVVHVIHLNGSGNISDAQVIDGINQINEDLKRLNPDTNNTRSIFKPYAGSIDVEFRLAKKDPQGNCTNGIVRVNSASTNNFGGADVFISNWDNTKYFNVWLVNQIANPGGQGIILGYAYFPTNSFNPRYGVVNRSDAWGRIGNVSFAGRTPTHEVGHALNLGHTFQGSCGSDCSSSGDFVCDTPPARSPTQGCNWNLNTCDNDTIGNSPFSGDILNQIENYMSYDDCQNMFSQGQVNRMTAALTNYTDLINLTSQQNLVNTGTDDAYFFTAPDCVPIAQFASLQKIGCVNDTFSLVDLSYNDEKDSTWTYNWSFPGGTPASSNEENPEVSYDQAGVYNISLTVSNASGSSNVETKTNYIEVREGSGSFIAPKKIFFTEPGFPNYQNDPSLNWKISQVNANHTWERTNSAFLSGPASLYIRNYEIAGGGITHSLISPVTNLTQLNNAFLNFNIAYARKNNETELMSFYYSSDCGANWVVLKLEPSINLYTRSPLSNQEFVPSNTNEWMPYSLDISQLAGLDDIMFRIDFKSFGGNNIYIDNFEISESPLTNLDNSDELQGKSIIDIYPNPANSSITIEFGKDFVLESQTLMIIDPLGRIHDKIEIAKGTISMKRDISDLQSGLYYILSTDPSMNIKKLIKE